MRKSLIVGSVLAVAAAAAGGAVQPALAGDHLTIVSWGGALQESQRKAFFEPFSKATGIEITDDEWAGEGAKIRAMVESRSVSWDLVDNSAIQTTKLCAEGIIETIDWNKLGFDRAKFAGTDKQDCGVPTVAAPNVIAYDKDKLPNGPKTISDFFDLQKFPGKRGLTKGPQGILEWALIADGVAVKDVYKVLSTPEGIDRAFKKLDTIKKDVVWWTSGAQHVQLLADGQVVMTHAWSGRIYDAVKNSGRHFQIMWDAQQPEWNYWTIPKGTPRRDAVYKFIAFAASPQVQAAQTRYIPYAPSNKDAMTFVDPAILPQLPTTPDHMANALIRDYAFWAENLDALSQRFTAWLAK